MEANANALRHWEDVVFENRNKLYGAYLLRRAYANRLLSGCALSVLFIAVLLSLQTILSKEDISRPQPPPLDDGGIVFKPAPEFLPKRKPQHPTTTPRTNPQNRSVVVTTDEVIEEERIEAVEDFIEAEGFGSGEIGMSEGTGTIALPDPQPVIEPKVRDFAEVMPYYEGGVESMMKFIQKKIRYPRVPREMGIEGIVFVRFVVNGDGSISDVEIIKGVHPDYDKEAQRVISMLPAWKGGSHNGRPVAVRMVLPIRFNLQK